MFVNGKEILKFKANNKNVTFPTQFCLGRISNRFSATECREVSLNGNVYDSLVNHNSSFSEFLAKKMSAYKWWTING